MDLSRRRNFLVELFYEDMSPTGGYIIDYKPPKPTSFRKGVKAIHGYTYFQEDVFSDCEIGFTIVFQIDDESEVEVTKNIDKYIKFIKNYGSRFVLKDEFGRLFKGHFQGEFNVETPVEGDVYHISVKMLCNHEITGWVKDNEKL